MRYVVTGARGMLGTDVVEALQGRNVIAAGSSDLNISNAQDVTNFILPGDVIINCAGYTQVDEAESFEDLAFAVNARGVQNLARAARQAGAKLITISTDYVFAGNASSPYAESEPRAPISAYGRSKAEGEFLAQSEYPNGTLIVRTAWLYGKNGANFAQTMLNLAKSRETWAVVDDQRGQPTWTRDLAQQIVKLIDSDAPAGLYHGTNSGDATWFDFAQAVLVEAGHDANRVTPTDSSSFVRPAPRPTYSVLGHGRWEAIGIPSMRPWREALHDAFESGAFDL